MKKIKKTSKIEFEENFSEKVIETIVAFANHKGGKILLGVKKNGEIIGINDIQEKTIQNWLNKIKTNWQLALKIEKHNIDGKTIIEIEQSELQMKPVSYNGVFYKRIKNTNHIMTASEITEEYLKSNKTSQDMLVSSENNIDDLNFVIIKYVMDKINKRKEYKEFHEPISFLKKYGLIVNNKPSYGAMILFSNFYNIYRTVNIGVFQKDLILKDEFKIQDSVVYQPYQIFEYIKKYINKSIIITGQIENIQKRQYPLNVIKYIIMFFILNRNYDLSDVQIRIFPNYIEFFGTGGLQQKAVDEFLKGKIISKNKQIAKIFEDMGEIDLGINKKECGKIKIKSYKDSFLIRIYES